MKKFLLVCVSFVVVMAAFLIFGGHANAHEVMGSGLAISPLLANMSHQELLDYAQESLTDNFDGDSEYAAFADLDESDMYDGFDDDIVAFEGGARSFLDEKKSGIYLTFSILNNSGYSKTIAINPAYFDCKGLTVTGGKGNAVTDVVINNINIDEIVAAGHREIDAVIAEGVVLGTAQAGITCTSRNGRINDHLRFIKHNPTRIPEITISSIVHSTGAVDKTFFRKIMTIRPCFPYQWQRDTIIDLNDSFMVTQYQPDKIVVDTHKYGMQADNQHLIFVQLDNDIEVTFKVCIGAIHNSPHALYKKAHKAHTNISQGTAGVVPVAIRKGMQKMKAKRLGILSKWAAGSAKK